MPTAPTGHTAQARHAAAAEINRQHDELREDRQRVEAYGAEHPEAFAGWRLGRGRDGARLVAGFTRDLDAHAARLRALVGHADRLDVVAMPATVEELGRIRSSIERDVGFGPAGPIRLIGPGFGVVHVRLASWAKEDARRLVERYGDAVEVDVGAFRYPLEVDGRLPSPIDRSLPAPVTLEGLEWRVELASPSLEAGATGDGRVVVRNRSAHRVAFGTTQPLVARLVDPGTGRVVGGFTGTIAGTGRHVDVGLGDEVAIALLIGSDSFDPALGYTVPPGRYRVQAVVPVGTGLDRPAVRVPEVDLEVVPRPSH